MLPPSCLQGLPVCCLVVSGLSPRCGLPVVSQRLFPSWSKVSAVVAYLSSTCFPDVVSELSSDCLPQFGLSPRLGCPILANFFSICRPVVSKLSVGSGFPHLCLCLFCRVDFQHVVLAKFALDEEQWTSINTTCFFLGATLASWGCLLYFGSPVQLVTHAPFYNHRLCSYMFILSIYICAA